MKAKDMEILEKRAKQTAWGQRILAEIRYARRLSAVNKGRYDDLIENAISILNRDNKTLITEEEALQAEEVLADLKDIAKKYKVILAGHAHIDMNWQWRWDETVAITLDTFKTVLKLMEEYPDFKFSQSQASVYKIMEEHDPEGLEEIKKRVKEGRWEVTASTWVEGDKNISGGESMVRQILYTKKYLSSLLEIAPDSLTIDFEPDTFGHSFNVPEILTAGGIKYYYHCRGYQGHSLYRWQGKSGKEVIVNREPNWYNDQISPVFSERVPVLCEQNDFNYLLKVYGIGDHGGGPTRRDLERINEMKKWPVFPDIEYGTFKEYFEKLETIREKLPVVNKELNYIFTGCYTSQSRIKKYNKVSENVMVDAEIFNTFSDINGNYSFQNDRFATAWQNILLNQFHDILPGSGTIDTREHAMGLYQDTLATATSSRKLALNKISEQINTAELTGEEEDISESISEGAGVGFAVDDFQVSASSREGGLTRVFHIFNSALFSRKEVVEIIVWDWQGNPEQMKWENASGEQVEFQMIDQGTNHYWGHQFIKVLIEAEVPACGYSTYLLKEDENYPMEKFHDGNPRVEEIPVYKLENEFIRAVFDSSNGSLTSLIDKETGENLVKGNPGAIFRLIDEDDARGMTSWVVGRYMDTTLLNNNVKIKKLSNGQLRQQLQLELSFRNSSLRAIVTLDKNSKKLKFRVECDWLEKGERGNKIPQLNFYLPLAYDCVDYKYDIPFATINREEMKRDVPALGFAMGMPQSSTKGLMLLSNDKNGFRAEENSLALSLIRSSYDPDPFPELGRHKFNFSICLLPEGANQLYLNTAYQENHPLQVISGSKQKGQLPAVKSFVNLKKGSLVLSDIKVPENKGEGKSAIIRLYEVDGQAGENILEVNPAPQKAVFVDLNEKINTEKEINIQGNSIKFEVSPYSIASILVEF